MKYDQMKKAFMKGFQTWNVRSVLSHVHMPDGFSVNVAFKEYSCGHYLKETLIGRFPGETGRMPAETAFPGLHAYDASYTEMTVSWCGMEIRVESAQDEERFVLLITPLKQQERSAMCVLEGGYLWGKSGYVYKENGALIGKNSENEIRFCTTGEEMTDANIPVQAAYLSVRLDKAVAFFSGCSMTLEKATAFVAQKREALLLSHIRFGEDTEFYAAMECAMAWDTIYDAKNDRVISPVSRLWSITSGGYVLFCWDNFFAGFMASLGSKEIAVSNLKEILNERTKEGFVPNFAYGTGQVSADRSQPPVGSAMIKEACRVLKDMSLIEDTYQALLNWNTWFYENRMNENGTLSWGSNPIPVLYGNHWEITGVNERFGAALESGLDNSPMYDDMPFDPQTHRMMLEDVGLTGLYILDTETLKEFACLLKKDEDEKELTKRLMKAESGLESLWDETNGFYYNRRSDTGEFSRRISPTNFYALFSSRVSSERIERISKEHYFNPEEFYGEWMLPSIARNDPAYYDQEYWRGRVWAPLNFLVYLAFTKRLMTRERRDLAQKSKHIFMQEWTRHKHVHENYNSITGEGCDSKNSDKFYHWGALLCMIALIEDGFVPSFGENMGGENA
ncbi:MAG: hypothetical protein E7322_06400 [Clostridiales bacterium]|nr:hypothetical protein [Clostridiales bacterium]